MVGKDGLPLHHLKRVAARATSFQSHVSMPCRFTHSLAQETFKKGTSTRGRCPANVEGQRLKIPSQELLLNITCRMP
eukprot:4131461-Amphidinium_carterae.1